MSHDIYICSEYEDKLTADAICTFLEARNMRCWYPARDMDSRQNTNVAISEAIKSATMVILVFSDAAINSKEVNSQIGIAIDSDKIIIPFKLTDTEPNGKLGFYLKPLHWLDALNQEKEQAILELSDRCAAKLNGERNIDDSKETELVENNSSSAEDVYYDDFRNAWIVPAVIISFLFVLMLAITVVEVIPNLYNKNELLVNIILIVFCIILPCGLLSLLISQYKRRGKRESFMEYAINNQVLKCQGYTFIFAFLTLFSIVGILDGIIEIIKSVDLGFNVPAVVIMTPVLILSILGLRKNVDTIKKAKKELAEVRT